MTSLHARKKHLADDEESGMISSLRTSSSLSDPQSKKRRGAAEMRLALAIAAVFAFVGFVLGYLLLHHQHRKVVLHVMKNPWAHGGAALRMAARRNRHSATGHLHHFFSGSPRFVTVVMPSVVNPGGRKLRLDAIHDTWGPCARAIYILHNITEFPKASHLTISEESADPQLKLTDKYSYPQNLLLPPEIGVDDGVPRLFYTLRTVHKKIDPDFAFFVNDHTFMYVDHLHSFLENQSPNNDLYAGHALKNNKNIFNSGAAGYILSRETMRKLIEKWEKKDPNCSLEGADSNKKWLQGNPGLLMTTCLNSMGIKAIDTREHNKYHRFHAFPLTRVVTEDVDGWYVKKHQLDDLPEDVRSGFDSSYSTLLTGPDCCSSETVSFHYIEYSETRALFAVRNALLKKKHMSDQELKDLMIELWPTDRKDIGGYSRGLPREENKEAWSVLLQTIRKISARESLGDC